jgi:NO-binding membrane sensor protein with MHYT domain
LDPFSFVKTPCVSSKLEYNHRLFRHPFALLLEVQMLIGSYSSSLVLISLCVAILASYTALDLTGRIATAKGVRCICGWGRGTGHGHRHLVDALHRHARLQPADQPGLRPALTALSLLIAVLSSGFALWLVSQPKLPWLQLGFGALIMGTGIACMHYTGMAALRMQPGSTMTRPCSAPPWP